MLFGLDGCIVIRPADWLMSLLVFFLIFSALWGNFHLDGGRDWDQSQADLLSVRRAIFEEKELPFWMPYRAGGHDAFADPQSLWLSPYGLLVLAFGFSWGARIFVASATGFGALGAMTLGSSLGLTICARMLLVAVLCLSSPIALYTAGGLPQFVLGAAILPWLILLIVSGSRKAAITAGMLLALDLYGGDVNHFVFHSLFVLLLGIFLSMTRRSLVPIASAIVIGISAFVFSAPKFIPTALFAYDNPRKISGVGYEPGLNTRLFLHALISHDAALHMKRHHGELLIWTHSGKLHPLAYAKPEEKAEAELFVVWINAGAYVGEAVLLLAICAGMGMLRNLLRIRRTHHQFTENRSDKASPAPENVAPIPNRSDKNFQTISLALLGPTVIFIWLSFGANVTPSAWNALHGLPLFSSFRSPPRMILYVLPFIGLLAAGGLQFCLSKFSRFLGKKMTPVLVWIAAIVVMADIHLASRDIFGLAFCEKPVKIQGSPEFKQLFWPFELARTWYGPPVTPFVRAGKGVVNGYCALPISIAAVSADSVNYRGEAFFADIESGQVLDYRVSARRVRVSCRTISGGEIVINQNWSKGWYTIYPVGTETVPFPDGRILVRVPPQTQHVILEYTPPGLLWGFWVFLLGAPVLVLWGNTRKESQVRRDKSKRCG